MYAFTILIFTEHSVTQDILWTYFVPNLIEIGKYIRIEDSSVDALKARTHFTFLTSEFRNCERLTLGRTSGLTRIPYKAYLFYVVKIP